MRRKWLREELKTCNCTSFVSFVLLLHLTRRSIQMCRRVQEGTLQIYTTCGFQSYHSLCEPEHSDYRSDRPSESSQGAEKPNQTLPTELSGKQPEEGGDGGGDDNRSIVG